MRAAKGEKAARDRFDCLRRAQGVPESYRHAIDHAIGDQTLLPWRQEMLEIFRQIKECERVAPIATEEVRFWMTKWDALVHWLGVSSWWLSVHHRCTSVQ
ncbi:hypothetical protein ccbrp13_17170 [Ktedonobacteria bacterium brp13]|nr:hypothetical protein ccbrp13_17170 [Ktedonobacteria bacterium brp13]